MPSLWFVVPVHGRPRLASICLRQLHRTCERLADRGIRASAVLIGDLENLRDLNRRTDGLISIAARSTGPFASVIRENRFLSRKFNDGIQLACDPEFNPDPVDFVVPCGSDDWVHPDVFSVLPSNGSVVGFQRLSFVREDGREMATSNVNYPGGCGVRIYPRHLMQRLGCRPADEDRTRGCDTSILRNVQRDKPNLRITHVEIDPRWIVDWKSPVDQINSYDAVGMWKRAAVTDPWEQLAGLYDDDLLAEMRSHYAKASGRRMVAA